MENLEIDEDLIYRTKSLLIKRYPTFAQEIANANLEYRTDLRYKTVATDGKNIYFDPDYMKSLSDDERIFLTAHEVMHIKFEHMYRMKNKDGSNKDMDIWNQATDAIINANLEKDGFKLQEGCVNRPEAINYTSEEFYEILLKEKQENQNKQNQNKNQNGESGKNGQGGESQESQNGQIGDDHSMWEKVSESQNKEDQSNSNDGENQEQNSNDDKDGKNKESKNGQDGENKNSQNNQNKNGEDLDNKDKSNKKDNQNKADKKDKKSNKKQQESSNQAGKSSGNTEERHVNINEKTAFEENRKIRVERAKQTVQRLKNKLFGGDFEANIKDDINVKPVVDWRLLLRTEFEKTETIWTQRRSIAENNYAYRLEENDLDDEALTEVMIDTSGSVDDDMVRAFLRQVKVLAKDTKLRVACFDHRFHGFIDIKRDRDIDEFRIVGHGGTDFNNAAKNFSSNDNINKVIFTDGCDSYTGKDGSIIWIVYENKNFKPKYGTVIFVEASKFNEYNNLIQDEGSLTR